MLLGVTMQGRPVMAALFFCLVPSPPGSHVKDASAAGNALTPALSRRERGKNAHPYQLRLNFPHAQPQGTICSNARDPRRCAAVDVDGAAAADCRDRRLCLAS